MRVPKSTITPVAADLIEKIRQWRNSPRVRENMLDDTMIEPLHQEQWFEGLAKSKDKQYRVFHQDSRPIGMLYFSDINKNSCSWGCYIGEQAVWPGTGVLLSVAALDYAFNILKVEYLFAEVFEKNLSPIKIHTAFEYKARPDKLVCTKGGREMIMKCFEFRRSDWMTRREIILAKLPKQIRQAADSIVFI